MKYKILKILRDYSEPDPQLPEGQGRVINSDDFESIAGDIAYVVEHKSDNMNYSKNSNSWFTIAGIIAYGGIQGIFWIFATIQFSILFIMNIASIEQDLPEWQFLWYMGYFIWTNQLLIRFRKSM